MITIENTQECFVQLWLRLERTRRLLGGQCKRFCIRNVLKSWFGFEANDDMIWEVCRLCEQEGWNGHVGFVPAYLKEIGFSAEKTALVCGPPIMIKFTLAGLTELGFDKTQVYTTMELRMKCGVGKCGRCNIGAKYVCKDGPVFRCDELDELPDEY